MERHHFKSWKPFLNIKKAFPKIDLMLLKPWKRLGVLPKSYFYDFLAVVLVFLALEPFAGGVLPLDSVEFPTLRTEL